MKILSKTGDEIMLLAVTNDFANKGDYFIIEDFNTNKKLLVQIYDEEYLSSQSLADEIIKDEVIGKYSSEYIFDPLEINNLSQIIRDVRLFRTKIRGSIDKYDNLSADVDWVPSRVNSKIIKISYSEIKSLIKKNMQYPIPIGKSGTDNQSFEIYAEDLDGKLNIITGKKETGKSHLSKILIKNLIQYGAYVIVFDLNNEYSGLLFNNDGGPSSISDKLLLLEPGKGLRFDLRYCGKPSISNMLRNALDMPAASLREFFRIWDSLENKKMLGLEELGHAFNTWSINELVRDALLSRFYIINSSLLFTSNRPNEKGFQFEDLIKTKTKGAGMIINMSRVSPVVRRMIVELVMNKLIDLLEKSLIPPIFIFAEEAHLYIRDTYWEDLITRMRHFGIYTTFITNQPDALSDTIYRQVDNIFLFNFTNDADLEKISKVSLLDSSTIKSLVKTLSYRNCLSIGKVVSNLPMVVKIDPVDMVTLGETKKFFK
ncbi:MAG: ATP-binding protein [Nitrosopumilus sp.]|nr:ATP-binding protein [Nitrosopumilus sp.]